VGHEKGILLTDGVKSVKDTLFFETNDADDFKSSKAPKKPPVKPLTNGNSLSPAKNKTVAGKVLRTKTRSAAQEEVMMTTAAKIKEHQTELHTQLQAEGLSKHSEDGGGSGGKEGKGWKRFQSYKGDAALPKEAESMKVRPRQRVSNGGSLIFAHRYTLIARHKRSCYLFMGSQPHFTSTPSKMRRRTMKEISHTCVSIFRHQANSPARRKMQYV